MKKNLIDILVLSNDKEISILYDTNRASFLGFGKKYGLDYDDISDIYQEAFIALRNHAISGKLNTVESTLKTYLFGIGKFMIYDRIKEKGKTTSYEPTSHGSKEDTIASISYTNEPIELTLEQHTLRVGFKKIGKNCQKLLTLFYSRGLSIDDIVEITDYKQNSVVRSQKSRCLKSLKELIKA